MADRTTMKTIKPAFDRTWTWCEPILLWVPIETQAKAQFSKGHSKLRFKGVSGLEMCMD